MTASFCINCGAPRSAGNFCAICGAAFASAAPTAALAAAPPEEERDVWSGAPDPVLNPVASRTTKYRVTTERVIVDSGIIGKHNESLQLFRVKDVTVKKSLPQRTRGVGDLHLISTDPSDPNLLLESIRNPDSLAEELRRLVQAARRRANVFLREGL